MELGFIGIGVMGQPMALNLARSGARLTVWNRTAGKLDVLADAGARIADTPDEVFRRSETVVLMMADEPSTDAVLSRRTNDFARNVSSRYVVHMGTNSPEYSRRLSADIGRAGGHYLEAPVSGSREPAESGELVAMLAGAEETAEYLWPHLKPMCRDGIYCGGVPNALLMKLAVNHFLITMVTGLSEAVHFAGRNGIDLEKFRTVIDAGPMSSSVSRMKLPKLVVRDFTVQAAIADVLKNNRLVADAARRAGVESPLLDACHQLYQEALELGKGQEDMVSVIEALEARIDRRR